MKLYLALNTLSKLRPLETFRRLFSTESGFIDEVLQNIRTKKAVIIGSQTNSDVKQALEILRSNGVSDGQEFAAIDLDKAGTNRSAVERVLSKFTCRNPTSSLVFVKGDCVGNTNDLADLDSKGILNEWLRKHDYDLIVIGGGSGGLAAAQLAGTLGKKVAVLDYVAPSPQGTSWGLGGTCVNVGCIPKKLMHHAALLGHHLKDARAFGWKFDEKVSHDWTTMKNAVQEHIKSLNFVSRVALNERKVKYLNKFGKFVGSHTIEALDKKGAKERLSADRFLIATGLRPRYPDDHLVPGAKEYCITSDDLFNLPYPPGKTLVIGASYVALECAGFLHGTGFDVTVMARSILLRGFDQDMASRIGAHMKDVGIKFIFGAVPVKVELIKDGTPRQLRVVAKGKDGDIVNEYNTVILAIGRNAVTDDMGLDEIGVKRNRNKKLVCHNNEQSVSTPYVYAVGDVLDKGIELTPVAIQAGRQLIRRWYSNATNLCDYTNVPTAVFTPLEYGCCGMSEEDALKQFGADSVEVYHLQFEPLEFTVPHRPDSKHCYAKLVCNKKDNMRVVGFHILAPNAGEVTQGFSIGLKLNATKADFDRLIGIHPTVAESFTTLLVTKASGLDYKAGGC